jgi:hypothetical protein
MPKFSPKSSHLKSVASGGRVPAGSAKFVGNSGFLKGLLVGGAALASLAIITSLGLEAVAKITGDEDLRVAAQLENFLQEVKNEEMGCCMPACGETKKIICMQSGGEAWVSGSCDEVEDCQEVCCYPYGMMSKKMCEDQPDGQVAGKEECEKGFSATLFTKDSKAFSAGTEGIWEMTVKIFTCEEDWTNAKYNGTWNWDWSVKTPESGGFNKTDKAADDFQFQVNGGMATFTLGVQDAKVVIGEDRSIEMTFYMANLGEEITLSGNLIKGGSNCNDENNIPK